jgi:Na+/proline symporter
MAAVEDMVDLAKLGFAFFGAMLAGVGVVCFFASNATDSGLRKNVIMGMALGTTTGNTPMKQP